MTQENEPQVNEFGEFDEDDEPVEPVYFFCMCCGHTSDFDDECDVCASDCMEPVY